MALTAAGNLTSLPVKGMDICSLPKIHGSNIENIPLLLLQAAHEN